MKLALGTAQFGLPYGIANQSGQITRPAVTDILDLAWSAGIDTLDTAIAYGESEQRLGEVGVEQWRVVTKLPAVPDACADVAEWVHGSVEDSLRRLRIPKLYALLLHRSGELLGPDGDALYRALVATKEQGRAQKIGVSIYDPAELDAIWPQYRLDVVQAPFNILDRRLVTSGWLARLHRAGTEIHTRSVFLQGLLLMGLADRPAAFDQWQHLWHQWHGWLEDRHLTPLQACIGYAMSQPEVDQVVVGVDSVTQLQQILIAAGTHVAPVPQSLTTDDPQLINPSYWPTQ